MSDRMTDTPDPLEQAFADLIDSFGESQEHYWVGRFEALRAQTRLRLDALEAENKQQKAWLEGAYQRAEVQPCVICGWPVPQDDCWVCPCCGHEPICDEGNRTWDGQWWSQATPMPPLVQNLKARLTLAESSRASLEAENRLLRSALVGLVGVDGRPDLERMETVMRLMPAPAADKAATIDAIHALIATAPPSSPSAQETL